MTHVLVVDNYDSFVYNLVQYVGEIAAEVTVRRNDELSVAEVETIDPDGIILSPGPGTPEDAGVCIPLFKTVERPILGVCLGHQALCAAHGANVEHAPEVVHGKPSTVEHDGKTIFEGLPNPIQVGRYHSLAVDRADLPGALVETAHTIDDERSILMGARHRERPHFGVQFHPESILTGDAGGTDATALATGKQLIENFCAIAAGDPDTDPLSKNGPPTDKRR